MADSTNAAARTGSALCATFILLLPALWNRFPILEWDTGGYLARWFEGYLVPSRSTSLRTVSDRRAGGSISGPWSFSGRGAVWVIGLMLMAHRFEFRPAGLPAIAAALAATTSLPWLSS